MTREDKTREDKILDLLSKAMTETLGLNAPDDALKGHFRTWLRQSTVKPVGRETGDHKS